LTSAFVAFFVDLLATYRNFITNDGFDREGFIASQPADTQQVCTLPSSSQKTSHPSTSTISRFILNLILFSVVQFLELFLASQMFERFIDERAGRGGYHPVAPNNGAFESRVSFYQSITTKLGPQAAVAPDPTAGGRHWTLYEENYLQKKDSKQPEEKKLVHLLPLFLLNLTFTHS
jgi:hypothetical protein